MITWPENVLPLPKSNLSFQDDPRLLIQEMEVGTRQRRRFSDNLERLSVTWEMNQVQWGFFKTFVKNELNQGAEEISISLITVEGIERVTAKIVSGRYTERHYVGGVDVTAELEIINPPVLDEAIYYLISISDGIADGSTTYDDEFIAMNEKLYTFLNSISN